VPPPAAGSAPGRARNKGLGASGELFDGAGIIALIEQGYTMGASMEGYLQRPGNRELPRVFSDVLAAVMFEATYAEVRHRGLAGPDSRLPG
jgi:hypothetical protein